MNQIMAVWIGGYMWKRTSHIIIPIVKCWAVVCVTAVTFAISPEVAYVGIIAVCMYVAGKRAKKMAKEE